MTSPTAERQRYPQLFSNLALVLGLVALVTFSPPGALDPWNLFYPKKIAQMILAILLVQLFGIYLKSWIGLRSGNLITGFLGGLISSTATTLTLAKQSRQLPAADASAETLVYYAATLAMLAEAVVLVSVGGAVVHPALFIVFAGPILLTIVQIYRIARRSSDGRVPAADAKKISLSSILKLTLFIVAILAVSKLGQQILGDSGLAVLTFLISLFEIHASIISNVQLYTQDRIGLPLLTGLLAASILASYLSKLFLVKTLGGPALTREIFRWTLVMTVVILLSLGVALAYESRIL